MNRGEGDGTHLYAIALGSNRRHHCFGNPRNVIAAATASLGDGVVAAAKTIETLAIGYSKRRYANAALILASRLDPPQLLAELKRIERRFGRRRGRRWSARTLDLDIILWSGGIWAGPGLSIPHPGFRSRRFVLAPLSQIAADWRDPATKLAVRHLAARLDRPRPRS